MAGILAAATGAMVYLTLRRRRRAGPATAAPHENASDLEQRVRVLERIATDRSIDLADEIEALRAPDTSNPEANRLKSKEEQSQ